MNRLRKAWAAVGSALRRAVLAIVSDRGELNVLLGLVLVTAALWPTCGRAALIVPGTVLIWVSLPERSAFVKRPPTMARKD